ncbi:MAG TPA: amidohydrolase [Dehalococcoidia bacterium]|nr:amidohydrolase [Dehalococcoidia bacterium]
MPATLVFHNARVITMDASRPRAQAVAVEGERILAVGSEGDVRQHVGPRTEVIDCGGRAVLPGFIDGHCHLLAYAASLFSVDCSPTAVSSIADIQAAIRRRAEETPAGRWIRAVGYSEVDLAEARHPTRWDLDAAAPDHPVRLIHRSGHACVLNSPALRLCSIDITTEEPPGGYLDRDTSSGEPTGLLLEMNELVERAVPPLAYEELAQAVGLVGQRFLAVGVTSLVDATHTNGPPDWELISRLRREGRLAPRVAAMVGIDHLEEGERWRSDGEDEWISLGAAKIVIKELGDEIHPTEDELAALVAEAHGRGWQVAIHAVEERAVAAAVAAYEAALARRPRADHRHRIEHCGLCPPELAKRIAAGGVLVVTQPSFLYYNGDRYLGQVPPEKQACLYPLRSLGRGVSLAAGSDCPVVAPDVIAGLYGAVARRSAGGRPLPGAEAVGIQEALAMYTTGAAFSTFAEGERGSIGPGRLADLVVLSGDPSACPPEDLLALRPEMTIVGGRVAWSSVTG